MAIKIKGSRKANEEILNGLNAIEEELRAEPQKRVPAIVWVEVVDTGNDWEKGGEPHTKVKFPQIEPILDPVDQLTITALMDRVYTARTGNTATQGSLFDPDAKPKEGEAPTGMDKLDSPFHEPDF